MVDGVSIARLIIDETGHVTELTLRRSVGGARERAWMDWLQGCPFAPARLNGRPIASPFVAAIKWTSD
jgi:hypothetical protein